MLLEEIYLDRERFAGLEKISLAGRSLSQWVEEHFHMRPESADQNFRIAAPGADRAEALELDDDSAILLVKRFLHFPLARNAIYAEFYCRTDQLVFSQTLTGQGATHADSKGDSDRG